MNHIPERSATLSIRMGNIGETSNALLRMAVLGVLTALAALASAPASAGGPHGKPRVSVSFSFGYPVHAYSAYRPWHPHAGHHHAGYHRWHYSPHVVYRSAYPVVVTAPPPVVYVEQPQVQALEVAPVPAQPQVQAQAQGDWFYCADSRAYYPYVRECPGGWQRVPAQPPR